MLFPLTSSPPPLSFASLPEKFQLVPEFLKARGLVREHLESYNYFVTKGIQKIVRVNNRVVSACSPDIYLEYKNVRVGEPTLLVDHVDKQLSPHISDLIYSAGLESIGAKLVANLITKAGTIAKGAALIREEGAEAVYACCTHGVFRLIRDKKQS